MYDLNLQDVNSTFNLTKETYTKLNTNNLPEILFNFLRRNQNFENQLNFTNKITTNDELISKQENTKLTYKLLKDYKFNKQNHFPTVQKNLFSMFNHMKSILGHIQLIDNTIIIPVPIYCLVYSSDDTKVITGDNIGLIKI